MINFYQEKQMIQLFLIEGRTRQKHSEWVKRKNVIVHENVFWNQMKILLLNRKNFTNSPDFAF